MLARFELCHWGLKGRSGSAPATKSSSGRGRTSPELSCGAREEAGLGAFERDTHPGRDGEDGGVDEGSTATNLEKSVAAAGGDLAKQASYLGLPGSIPCGR